MNRSRPKFRRTFHYSLVVAGLLSLAVPLDGRAGVIQHVSTTLTPGDGSPAVSAEDTVFELTSGDITRDAYAGIGAKNNPDPGYWAFASAGRFGTVGLDAGMNFGPSGTTLQASVLVGSDEFVNLSSQPAMPRASFIIDGGALQDFSSANSTVEFVLSLGIKNNGPVGAETNAVSMVVAAAQAANRPYFATLSSDEFGTLSFSALRGIPDVHLWETFDPNTGLVEIPFSLQSTELLDFFGLGTPVQPGDRITVGYEASIEITIGDFIEGSFGSFSDPFTIDGDPTGTANPNPILDMTIDFVPIPEPAGISMAGLLLGAICLARRNGVKRTVESTR